MFNFFSLEVLARDRSRRVAESYRRLRGRSLRGEAARMLTLAAATAFRLACIVDDERAPSRSVA